MLCAKNCSSYSQTKQNNLGIKQVDLVLQKHSFSNNQTVWFCFWYEQETGMLDWWKRFSDNLQNKSEVSLLPCQKKIKATQIRGQFNVTFNPEVTAVSFPCIRLTGYGREQSVSWSHVKITALVNEVSLDQPAERTHVAGPRCWEIQPKRTQRGTGREEAPVFPEQPRTSSGAAWNYCNTADSRLTPKTYQPLDASLVGQEQTASIHGHSHRFSAISIKSEVNSRFPWLEEPGN